MRRIFFTQFMLVLFCNQVWAIYGLFRFPFRLLPSFNHQSIYVPQHQLIVYPRFHQPPIPQFYQSSRILFIPQHNTYSSSQYFLHQPTSSYYDPIVSYVQHQTPHQPSSYMNFNLDGELSNEKPGQETKILDETIVDKPIKGLVIKSGLPPDCHNNENEEFEKQTPKEMVITPDDAMETTTNFESTKNEEEEINFTTETISKIDFKKKSVKSGV